MNSLGGRPMGMDPSWTSKIDQGATILGINAKDNRRKIKECVSRRNLLCNEVKRTTERNWHNMHRKLKCKNSI